MSGWAGQSNNCDKGDCKTNCKTECERLISLEEQIALLQSELRDTNKKTRSKLDFLLKRIQHLEEKSVDNT